MSAFLGPIHYWLYHKVELQENLVDRMVALAREQAIPQLKETLKTKYGEFDRSSLETIIDGTNIHGWLQDKVSRVEYKLAEGVTTLLNQEASLLAKLEEIFYTEGEKRASILLQDEGLTLHGVYKAISDSLLDGMPCDRAVGIIKEAENEIAWQTIHCVHQKYWDEVGGDIANYYKLRAAYLNGFAHAIDLNFEVLENRTYVIKRV